MFLYSASLETKTTRKNRCEWGDICRAMMWPPSIYLSERCVILYGYRNFYITAIIYWPLPGFPASAPSSIRTTTVHSAHERHSKQLLNCTGTHKETITQTQSHLNNLPSSTTSARCWRFPWKHVLTSQCGQYHPSKSQMLCDLWILFCAYCE